MPQRQRRNDSDYIRFRPYHAFTSTPADRFRSDRWNAVWRVVLTIGILALISGAAILWLRR